MMNTDYLIIGQGMCGTWLSYYLLQAGKSIRVIDNNHPHTASKVASGVINPVTGRRIVRTWRIEELLPFASVAYDAIGKELNATLAKTCAVIDFHPSPQMKEAFEKRLADETEYLHSSSSTPWKQYFNFYFGSGEVSPCLLIDIHTLLTEWRKQLQHLDCIVEEEFDLNHCSISESSVTYKNICAKKIIFCDGAAGFNNPYFKNLPFALNKGETIIAEIPLLPKNKIYKHGLSIVPWKDDLFWIGSSYEWSFENAEPTPFFKEKTTRLLNDWLKLPYKMVEHMASVRPATLERRPFVGVHPKRHSVAILNGMGTKGCSLAPFFAKQLASHLVLNTPIYADADVQRFAGVLAR